MKFGRSEIRYLSNLFFNSLYFLYLLLLELLINCLNWLFKAATRHLEQISKYQQTVRSDSLLIS